MRMTAKSCEAAGNSPETHVRLCSCRRSSEYGQDKVGTLVKNVYGTQDASHIWQLDQVNLICGELGGFRRATHSAALFHNPNQDVRMAVHGDDCVFVRRWWTQTHRQSSQIRIQSERHSIVELCFQSRIWSNCTVLGHWTWLETRSTLVISELGCNAHTKAVSKYTMRGRFQTEASVKCWRDKMQHETDLWDIHIRPKIDYTVHQSRSNWLREWVNLVHSTLFHWNRAARYSVGKPKLHCDFENKNTSTKIGVFVGSDFACDSVEKNTTGSVAQIANHTVKPWPTFQSLTLLIVGEAEFYAVVKGGQIGLSLRSIYHDLGIPMKIEIQSDSSASNSFAGSAGSETTNETNCHACTRKSSRWRYQYQ